MRKWIAGWVALMLMGCSVMAYAKEIPLASPLDLHKSFERYQSYQHAETGEWSAHNLDAAQLLRTLSAGSARSFMSTGACVFYPSVRGNSKRSFTEIVLNVCLLRNQPIHADSLCIVVQGKRYDFLAPSENERIGTYACERFSLPLDALGLEMLSDIAEHGCALTIYGESRFYRTTIDPATESPSAKQALEATSLSAARSLLSEFSMPAQLWDLNAAYWAKDRAEMACVALTTAPASDGTPALDSVFNQLRIDDRSAVRTMQQTLKDNQFYASAVDGRYGANTRTAIREAQRYYGLLETGQADQVLMDCLAGLRAPTHPPVDESPIQSTLVKPNEVTPAEAGRPYRLEGVAELRMDRYWYAAQLQPANRSAPTAQSSATAQPAASPSSAPVSAAENSIKIEPTNASNMLLILDGALTNLDAQPLFLPLGMQATVLFGDHYAYPCSIRCETSQGTSFGTQLLPLEKMRILLYAQVPQDVLSHESPRLSAQITTAAGTMALNFQMQ